jgi:hypothetical protein
MLLEFMAQAASIPTPAASPWWTSPIATVAGSIAVLFMAEYLRRRSTASSATATVQVEHLKSMAALAMNEKNERHKLAEKFNTDILRLQVDITNQSRMIEWIKSAFSELYYSHQRSWDAFEAFTNLLKHDNPGIMIDERMMPKRPDISHLAPIKIFRPMPDYTTPPPPALVPVPTLS